MLDIDYEYVTNRAALPAIAEELIRVDCYGLDTETAGTSVSPLDGVIRLIQLNLPSGIYVIDLFQVREASVLFDAMNKTDAIAIGHNLKFEQKWLLYHHRVVLKRLFCTMRASFLIYNGKNLRHDIYSVIERELNMSPPVEDNQLSDWGRPRLTQSQLDYAAFDVVPLFDLRIALKKKLAKWGLNKAALLEFQVILPEGAIENKGIPFNKEKWLRIADENKIKAADLRSQLTAELPNPSNQLCFPGIDPPFNLDSPSQLLKSIQKLGVDADSTREINLAAFLADFPILKKLFAYRESSKAYSAFGPKYIDHIHPLTGRIHCDFYPFTAAGRYATSGPNLGQVPRDKRFRACFEPGNGRKIIVVDFSGIEMRGAAQITKDPTLTAIFKQGKDVHRATAAIIARKAEEEITKDERQRAKSANFGFLYGMGSDKFILYAQMGYGVTFSPAQAKSLRSDWFGTFSGIRAWQKKIVELSKRRGYSRTLSGRIRHYPRPEEVYSEYMNTPVQGSCTGDGMKLSLRNVYDRLQKYGDDVFMVHHVHDEIVTECGGDPDLVEAVNQDVCEGMKEAMAGLIPDIPIEVEGGAGSSWAEKG